MPSWVHGKPLYRGTIALFCCSHFHFIEKNAMEHFIEFWGASSKSLYRAEVSAHHFIKDQTWTGPVYTQGGASQNDVTKSLYRAKLLAHHFIWLSVSLGFDVWVSHRWDRYKSMMIDDNSPKFERSPSTLYTIVSMCLSTWFRKPSMLQRLSNPHYSAIAWQTYYCWDVGHLTL